MIALAAPNGAAAAQFDAGRMVLVERCDDVTALPAVEAIPKCTVVQHVK